MTRTDRAASAFLLVIYAVGLAFHFLPSTRAMMPALTPWALLATAAAAALPVLRDRDGRTFAWVAAAYAAGFALEAIGVATGAVFGAYSYGSVLGPMVLGVPLVIGLNWAFGILGAVTAVRRLVRRPLAAGLVTGLLVAGFDAVMEPVAIRLGYWTWASVGVPLQNHAAWFVIGGGLAAAYAALRPRTRAWAPLVAVAAQLVFFAGLRFLPA